MMLRVGAARDTPRASSPTSGSASHYSGTAVCDDAWALFRAAYRNGVTEFIGPGMAWLHAGCGPSLLCRLTSSLHPMERRLAALTEEHDPG
jgi:hypothetical protein